jgi:zinc protease
MDKGYAARSTSERSASGIDLVLLPTATADLVTARVALGLGSFESYDRETVATLLSLMLPSGVPGMRRSAVREKFDLLGASVSVSVGATHIFAVLTSRAATFPEAFALLMRVLAHPEPDDAEFAESVRKLTTSIEYSKEDTDFQAAHALARAQYRNGHPHWSHSAEELLRELRGVHLRDVRELHGRIMSSVGGLVVVAGDINPRVLLPALRRACAVIPQRVPDAVRVLYPDRVTGATGDLVLPIADKMNVDTYLGIPLTLTRDHTDFEALGVAVAILGGSSSGRLFNELRTRRSLTYGAYATLGGFDDGYPGYLNAHAIFPSDVFLKGRDALKEVVEGFVARGVTAQELAKRKEEILGKFVVGLSTTRGACGAVFGTLLAGKPLTHLDEYPERIRALTLRDVNRAIRTHIDFTRAMTSAAGGVRTDGSSIA